MELEKKSLNKSLGLQFVIGVVIANIIGSGVYKKVAPMAATLDSSGWVLVAWIAGGIITLFGALCNAEVAGLLADTGGEYAYYKKIYNRFLSFMFGWSLFTIVQSAAISSIAYVFAQSLNNMFHLPNIAGTLNHLSIGGIFYPFENFTVKLTAIILIGVLTYINTRGVKTGAKLSNIILLLVFAGIFTIVAAGLTSGKASVAQSFQFNSTQTLTFSTFFTAMLAAFWAYQGWYSIGFIGGEIKDANRTMPKGIAIGVFIVIAIYLLVNITYMSILSVDDFKNISQSGNQIAAVEAVRAFWGDYGVLFISFLIMVTTLGCTNASILTGARPYYAMAREGMFFKKAGNLNKFNAPAGSLVIQGIWSCVLVLSGSLDQLTDMVIFSIFIFYGLTALGVIILRKKMPNATRPYKVWGYPFVPIFFILVCVALIGNAFVSRPREAGIGVVLMLTGIPMYYFFKYKTAVKAPPAVQQELQLK